MLPCAVFELPYTCKCVASSDDEMITINSKSTLGNSLPVWGAFILVLFLGIVDGGMRAHFKLPTIMGEEVAYDSHELAGGMDGHIPLYTRIHGATRSLLAQVSDLSSRF